MLSDCSFTYYCIKKTKLSAVVTNGYDWLLQHGWICKNKQKSIYALAHQKLLDTITECSLLWHVNKHLKVLPIRSDTSLSLHLRFYEYHIDECTKFEMWESRAEQSLLNVVKVNVDARFVLRRLPKPHVDLVFTCASAEYHGPKQSKHVSDTWGHLDWVQILSWDLEFFRCCWHHLEL